ncbi:hypothetical protein [Paenibacillus nasutitermitis]|uniref:Alkaline ceramidase n=1 Tax=Paenibacillus nasutitermitis TaxID=1652958 RepID=A0A916YQG1_9BACL|nr:hypothetical protein [Paenibacillus nasutitermitis]GGD56338.1 alkaline ceramidase [Paenibacillus nasutitermitis]
METNAAWYEVGTFSVEITPPITIPYLAGDPRHSYFTGVHDPLYACAAVISDGTREAALISVDAIGFCNRLLGPDRDFTEELKHRIAWETGIGVDAIMIMSDHIHSSPDTINFRPLREIPAALPWLEVLCTQICNAVDMAAKHKFKARLKQGSGKVEGLIMNRRAEAYLDTEVGVLLFESEDMTENVILVNFACHPVIVQVQELVSADFIGAMRNVLQNGLKNIKGCLFIQGACGDINPLVGASKSFNDVRFFGETLAEEVMEVYRKIAIPDYPAQPVQLAVFSRKLHLASRPLPSIEEVKHLNNEEALWRIHEGDAPFLAEIQLIKVGNCIIVGIPGEPMSRMGLEIKEMFRPLISFPAGYTNGYVGYLASLEDWEKGGYEVDLGPWSKVGSESYDEIINVLASMNNDLINKGHYGRLGERDE